MTAPSANRGPRNRGTVLISHPACENHEVPAGHPETAARLQAVLSAFEDRDFAGLKREQAPRANRAELERVHSAAYVSALLARVPRTGLVQLDINTSLSAGSGEAALRAAGAVVRAVDLVMTGAVGNAFCAVRPPGHHAEPANALGFCLLNNIAVGALHARVVHGLDRIAVVDFDVHHGNGTEAMFAADPALFYASTHQMPLFPGTGRADAHGVANNIVNVPLRPFSDPAAFRAALSEVVLPRLSGFRPDFILISAGFDGHSADPLANLSLSEVDFDWATRAIAAVAAETCAGRIVSVLEGGYDLEALARCAAAHVRALMAVS